MSTCVVTAGSPTAPREAVEDFAQTDRETDSKVGCIRTHFPCGNFSRRAERRVESNQASMRPIHVGWMAGSISGPAIGRTITRRFLSRGGGVFK